MDFSIPEEIGMVLDAHRKFVEQELLPLEREEGLDKRDPDEGVPRELWERVIRRSGELGFYGIHMPEEFGGGAFNNVGVTLLREQAFSFGSPLAAASVAGPEGPSLILIDANDEQRKKYVEPLVRGEITTAFALTEPGAGSDAQSIKTRADRQGDHYVLNGQKVFITNGAYAAFTIVFAVTDPEKKGRGGISAFLVEKGTPGFRVGRKNVGMVSATAQYELIFEDCRVPAANLLGQEGFAFVTAMRFLGAGRLSIAAMCLGIAKYLLGRSTEYAKQRETFGRPIADRQAIQWMLAEMATDLYAARSMVYHAAWKCDEGDPIIQESSMCKLFATEMVNRVADHAVQIHGGMGWMRELDIERYYRLVRMLRIVEGTSEIQKMIIARTLLAQ
jgi:acyl-CoA dehydrogenase